ncbi:LrgB family protein [Alicyclobacillus fructus]|uniref:LrgB family protein n=1 Tax=Alicyclobacillus fructus TaxID=2816082 RepID=UPI001A8D28F0|nr:LrgB family protein [Alicyclobacillus fructus]
MRVLGILLTLACYAACKWLYRRVHVVWLNPMITSLVAIVALLRIAHISYAAYDMSARWLTAFLGPATVAFAVPLYRHFPVLKAHWPEFLLSLTFGSATGITGSVLLARLLRLNHIVVTSVAPRSVTTPIAMDISQAIGGIPTLTAVFVILTGITGVIVGPWLLRLLRLQSPVARGALFGMGSHGIGTARAFEYGAMEGTCSSLAMIVAAFITLALAPPLVNALG